jgi:cell division protein FtsQ
MWKKRLITAFWILFAVATTVLLGAAMQIKSAKHCSDVKIEISGVEDHLFVDEKEVLSLINKTGDVKGAAISKVNLRVLESRLEKNPWIQNAELFFDNNFVLQVKILETEPIARIFTMSGTSYYIDSASHKLPLSDVVSARVPMFTSFPSDNAKLSSPDSAVLEDVKHMAAFIKQDSFWMAQVAQIDITPKRTYQMVPVLGNQIIELGDATNIEKKFQRLYAFYKNVWAKTGFEKYSTIDVQYEGQVVATRKGVGAPAEDSLRAMELLNNTIEKVNAMVRDSLMNIDGVDKAVIAPVEKKIEDKKPEERKIEVKKPDVIVTKPATVSKATTSPAKVEPKKNDKEAIDKIGEALKKRQAQKKKNEPKAVLKKKS